jgi:hypothetical protein
VPGLSRSTIAGLKSDDFDARECLCMLGRKDSPRTAAECITAKRQIRKIYLHYVASMYFVVNCKVLAVNFFERFRIEKFCGQFAAGCLHFASAWTNHSFAAFNSDAPIHPEQWTLFRDCSNFRRGTMEATLATYAELREWIAHLARASLNLLLARASRGREMAHN